MAGGGLVFLGFCLIVASLIIVSVRVYQTRPDIVSKVMKYAIIALFGLVFSVIAIAIGFRIDERHTTTYSRSLKSVQEIWGGNIIQNTPSLSSEQYISEQYEDKKTGKINTRNRLVNVEMGFDLQDIDIKIDSSIRSKGLLKFPGYIMHFTGRYIIRNNHKQRKDLSFYFPLPQSAGNITDISVQMNDNPFRDDTNLADGVSWKGALNADEKRIFLIKYTAQGTGNFNYSLGSQKVEIKKLSFKVDAGFTDVDVPSGAMVPAEIVSDNARTQLKWNSENLVTGQNIALDFDIEGNYGKIVSKLFFYSPLSMFLFLGFLIIFSVARQIKLHPMNYLFIITGFFIFYLLASYMVSYTAIIPAIIISLIISSGIIIYYTYLIKKERILLQSMLSGVAIFQWIFSISFFFPEHTGFMITIASIIAFIALMRVTSSIDWENKW